MSASAGRISINRQQVRITLDRFRKSQRPGMVGIPELLGLGLAAFMILLVTVGYIYFLMPARSQVSSLQSDRDRLKKLVEASNIDFKTDQDTNQKVLKITSSVDKFETQRLVDRNPGRKALYEELNDLIRKNGLRNSSGPSYSMLEPLSVTTQERAAAAKSAGAKWQSIYPGIAVNVTLEGSYQNLRHFVRDLEVSKAFVVINAVELERATEAHAQQIAEASGSRANALVSLRMDLATYFQRPTQPEEEQVKAPAKQ